MITWIRSGSIVDTLKGLIRKADILIKDDIISAIGIIPSELKQKNQRVKIIDAEGMLIIPGLIDMHVHLREPGHEYKETILTGAIAAVSGGFTSIACMPNTDPVNDNRAVTEFIIRRGKSAGFAKIYPIACISKKQEGETLTEFGDIKDAGAVGISDDGMPVLNSELMRRATEYASYHGLTIISHSEDTSLSRGGVMNEGEISTAIGLSGIPSISEEIMVSRDILIAKFTKCPVHIAHVSTAGSVEIIKRGKEAGILVTAETAPHYFTLDHRAVTGYDSNTKMNPPLRTPEDVLAIKNGLADGIIDAIATDHAPHSTLEKDVEFDKAAFGIIGLETALPLTLALVRAGVISLPEAIKKLSLNPARILGIPGGQLEPGLPADLAIINPDYEYILKKEDILSKSKNSPFIGKALKGRNELTMIGGKIVWER